MELPLKRIPRLVASNPGENPGHRKSKGSPAMVVSWGSVGPKSGINTYLAKGKQVNIPAPSTWRLIPTLTLRDRKSRAVALFKRIISGNTVIVRTERKRDEFPRKGEFF